MEKKQILTNFVYPVLASIIAGLILSYISLLIPLNNQYDVNYIWLWTKVFLVFVISFTAVLYIFMKFRKKNKPIKVIVFDFDGTLTYNTGTRSSWEMIWKYLGYRVQDCQDYLERYKEGKIDHQTWCDLTCTCFKKKNLTRGTLESVSRQIQLMDGVKEILYKLKNEDHLKLYLVSGSIIQLIELLLGSNIDDFFEAYKANIMTFHTDNRLANIVGTEYDFEGKAEFMRKIIKREKLNSPSEILFIGNSENDEFVYRSGVQTLCFNPKQANINKKRIWNRHFRADSFNDLYEFLKKEYSFNSIGD